MGSNQRVIIGSEDDDSKKIELEEVGNKTTVPTTFYNSAGEQINPVVGFEIPFFDSIDLTYVSSGNGTGEIATVNYKANGGVVATLILDYNSDNKLITVTKS